MNPWEAQYETPTPVQESAGGGGTMPWEREFATSPVEAKQKMEHKTPLPSVLSKIGYGFESTDSDVNNAADIATAKDPQSGASSFISWENGGLSIKTPDEVYGSDFSSLPDERSRLDRINEMEKSRLETKYSDVIAMSNLNEDAAVGFGKLLGTLATPTSLLPAGKKLLTGVSIGAGLGAEHSILRQAADEGAIDKSVVAWDALEGAAVASVFLGTPLVGKAITNRLRGNKETIQLGELHGEVPAAPANMSKSQAQEVMKAIENDLIEGKLTIADQASSRDEIISLTETLNKQVSEKYKYVVSDIETFQQKAGKEMPFINTETAQRQDAINNLGAVNGLHAMDQLFGAVSTRIKNISVPAFGKVRNTEYSISSKVGEFNRSVNNLSTLDEGMWDLIRDQDWETAYKKASPAEASAMKDIQEKLNFLGEEFVKTGYINKKSLIEGYFPRYVKDLDGLYASVGKEEQGIIAQAILQEKDKLGRALTGFEESGVVNRVLRGKTQQRSTSAKNKGRVYDTIPEELKEYYYTPEESLRLYGNDAIDEIETRKFFGQYNEVDLKKQDKALVGAGRPQTDKFDIHGSIGAYVNNAMKEGENLNAWQQTELRNLLEARFGAGRVSAGKGVRTAKELTYLSLLANPISAITQFGDVGMSMAVNGLSNTVTTALSRANKFARGVDDKITAEMNLGIGKASQEMVGDSKVTKTLDGFMRWSGFTTVDRFGKNVYLEATMNKAVKDVLSPDGTAAVYSKYRQAFGEEKTLKLIKDLRTSKDTGKLSPEINEFLFNELADVQPIARSELPEKYLRHPNGAVVYALKTWTLKQIDVMRNRAYNQFRNGNHAEAAVNLGKIGLYLGGMNAGNDMIKDVIKGRDVSADEIPDRMVENMADIMLLNRYTREAWADNPVTSFSDILLNIAPLDVADGITRAPAQAIESNEKYIRGDKEGAKKLQDKATTNLKKSSRYIPYVGPLVESHLLGGKERYNEKRQKERKTSNKLTILPLSKLGGS